VERLLLVKNFVAPKKNNRARNTRNAMFNGSNKIITSLRIDQVSK